MPNPLQRVAPGQKLEIPARDWNAMLDTVRWAESLRRSLGGGSSDGPTPNPVIVRVKNGSGSDLPAGGILGIDEPIFPPTGDTLAANTLLQIDLRGVGPTENHRGLFVVTLQPLKSNAVGRAVISGACWAKVNADDDDEQAFNFAEVDESTTALQAVSTGSAQIVYRQAGTGARWAIMRLGNRPSDSSAGLFPVIVETDGGDGGTNGDPDTSTAPTAPTYTYAVVHGITGDALGTGMTPTWGRVAGHHSAATEGQGYFNAADQFVLQTVNELPDVTIDCTEEA